jgi:hypothetical protein
MHALVILAPVVSQHAGLLAAPALPFLQLLCSAGIFMREFSLLGRLGSQGCCVCVCVVVVVVGGGGFPAGSERGWSEPGGGRGRRKREAPGKKRGGVPGRGLSPEAVMKRKGGEEDLETRSGFETWEGGSPFLHR